MGDNGKLELISTQIAGWAQDGDRKRLLIGWRLSRSERHYGAGLVSAVSKQTGLSRTSLFEYAQIENAYRGRKMSAWRILKEFPNLYYSHLRTGLRLPDLETRYLELQEASEQGMSTDAFRIHIQKKLGKHVPPPPLFTERGKASQVLTLAQQKIQREGWSDREIEVIVRGVE